MAKRILLYMLLVVSLWLCTLAGREWGVIIYRDDRGWWTYNG
jgi:hypothetical protein